MMAEKMKEAVAMNKKEGVVVVGNMHIGVE